MKIRNFNLQYFQNATIVLNFKFKNIKYYFFLFVSLFSCTKIILINLYRCEYLHVWDVRNSATEPKTQKDFYLTNTKIKLNNILCRILIWISFNFLHKLKLLSIFHFPFTSSLLHLYFFFLHLNISQEH